MTYPKYPFLLALLQCFAACQNNKQAQTSNQTLTIDSALSAVAMPAQVPPNHCRILGKIVKIDSTLMADKTSPCGKAPCRATVKVVQVLGYGSAFGNPLADGQEMTVTFAFTLAPTTKELFPNMDARLPGLSLGATFKADVQSMEQLGGGAAYQIYNYQKQ